MKTNERGSMDWKITLALATAGALVGAGVNQATVGFIKEDVRDLKSWKDATVEKIGNMDGKLDALLKAFDVEYTPKITHTPKEAPHD